MIPKSTDGKTRVLSLSYGKDSLACLGACEILGLPLDRIVHAEVWATDTISADLPPMVEFKKKADAIIKDRWGIEVEHFRSKWTYEKWFYEPANKGNHIGKMHGFPMIGKSWCNKQLKMQAINKARKACGDCIDYVGIASDEIERICRQREHHPNNVLPLVEIGWTEADAMQWCIDNDLRSPTYDSFVRGGCWFCHNQGTEQLRQLRKQYPDLWQIMLRWDNDSWGTFKPTKRTIHDYDQRFQLEDLGFVKPDEPFKWSMLNEELNYRLF